MTELNFRGKEFVFNHHLTVPHRPLEVHADKGIGEPNLDGNLIVEGDNLHALKALLPTHAGRVDCVYIDPPYNTGNKDWAYADDVSSPFIKEWLSTFFDDNGERRFRPIDSEDALRHDKWSAMMWPRLRLLSELMTDEGTIFISVNSIEYARLKLIADHVFGQDAYIGEFIWKSRNNKDNRNDDGLSNDHEFVLMYGGALDGELRSATDYDNPDNDERGPWASANMVGLASREKRPNLHYELIDPDTDINYGCPRRGWRFGPETMYQMVEEKRIIWPAKKTGRPRRKAFLSEMDARTNVSSFLPSSFFTSTGSKELNRIIPSNDFSFPKPTQLVEHILSLYERDDITVLDSFAGSGTTAHAVLKANARDGGDRRFVLVEMEGYANTLTAERVRRVIRGYPFTGTQREELLRQKVTWTKLKRANKLVDKVEALENLHGPSFDRIKATMKDGELIVTGERKVEESAPGLGGTFTYCTLGEPLEMDRVLGGETLPTVEALAGLLHYTVTNRPPPTGALKADALEEGVAAMGDDAGRRLWLIYRPDLDWLKSPSAALTLPRARAIAATAPDATHFVFAPTRYVGDAVLRHHGLRVEFAPLPYALYTKLTARPDAAATDGGA